MRRNLILAVLTACLIFAACAESLPAHAAPSARDETTSATAQPAADPDSARARAAFLQRYCFDDSVRQVLLITHIDGSNAVASYYQKQEGTAGWTLTFSTIACVGRNGMNKTREGDLRTPSGDFAVTGAFGILPDPGTALPYTAVTPTTYACDENCVWYNQIIDTAATGHACSGEKMYYASPEYNYGLTISYNASNTYPAGSAIFIHCKGRKAYTSGCVALDESAMMTILTTAQPGMRVYLDDYYVQGQ